MIKSIYVLLEGTNNIDKNLEQTFQHLSSLTLQQKLSYFYDYAISLPWMYILSLLVISKLIGIVSSHFMLFKIQQILTEHHVDKYKIKTLKASARWLVTAGIIWSLIYLINPEDQEHFFASEMDVLFAAIFYWFLYSSWNVWAQFSINNRKNMSATEQSIVLPFVFSVVRFLIIVTAFISIGSNLGLNPYSAITALGAGGIGLSFAAKDTVENFFGTISIAVDQSFTVGDYIKVGEVMGTVDEINLRCTKIRTYNDTIITMPNGNVVRTPVENMSKKRGFRFQTEVHLAQYNKPEKIDLFYAAIQEYVKKNKKIDFDKSYINLNSVNSAGIVIKLDLFLKETNKQNWILLQHKILTEVLDLSEKNGIKFAVPLTSNQEK